MHWYVVYIRPSLMEFLTRKLSERGIPYYYPTRRVEIPAAEGRPAMSRDVAVMPNVMFLNMGERALDRLLLGREIEGILGRYQDPMTHRCAVVPDEEKERFQRLLEYHKGEVKLLKDPISRFRVNQHVRVVEGPLAGMEGYVVRICRDRKFVLSLGVMAFAVEGIGLGQLEPIDNDKEGSADSPTKQKNNNNG